ncbi:Fic family protein [Humibacter antri]
MSSIEVSDLAEVVYSSGKVFDGLSTGRLDTENFLRSGNLDGVTSRSDLALLKDLRDVAQFIIDHSDRPIDVAFVKDVNAQLTRSAALHPGQLRTDAQLIGVRTRYGRHEPDAMTDKGLQRLLDVAFSHDADPDERALEVFVQLAKAQPFEDGNKRTALFVANALLLGSGNGRLLTIPVDDSDPTVGERFNDLLARAYTHDEDEAVEELLRSRGFIALEDGREESERR